MRNHKKGEKKNYNPIVDKIKTCTLQANLWHNNKEDVYDPSFDFLLLTSTESFSVIDFKRGRFVKHE